MSKDRSIVRGLKYRSLKYAASSSVI